MPSFPTRRSYFGLALAFSAFAIYASLLPFELHRMPLEQAWAQFQRALAVSSRASRTDVLANVLLFIPVGFTLAGSVVADRSWRGTMWLTPLAVLPFSTAVSIAAEFLQTLTAERVPSRIDIAAQAVGTVSGVLLWTAAGAGVTGWIRTTLTASREHRFARVLAAFAAAWLFVNLAPFDITLDLGTLANRVREGRITLLPWGDADVPATRRAWDALAETLSAVPLGMFGLVAPFSRRRASPIAAFAVGATIVLLTELAQIFIRSHTADTADVAFGWLGTGVGVWIGSRLLSHPPALATEMRSTGVSRVALIGIVLWIVVLCAYHWLPYDFGVDYRAIRQKLGRVSLIPFAGYRRGSPLNALNDLLTKTALSIPLGLIAHFVLRPARSLTAASLVAWAAVAVFVFGVVEAGQFFLPRRSPDPTDVLVGVAGTIAGLVVAQWMWGHARR